MGGGGRSLVLVVAQTGAAANARTLPLVVVLGASLHPLAAASPQVKDFSIDYNRQVWLHWILC